MKIKALPFRNKADQSRSFNWDRQGSNDAFSSTERMLRADPTVPNAIFVFEADYPNHVRHLLTSSPSPSSEVLFTLTSGFSCFVCNWRQLRPIALILAFSCPTVLPDSHSLCTLQLRKGITLDTRTFGRTVDLFYALHPATSTINWRRDTAFTWFETSCIQRSRSACTLFVKKMLRFICCWYKHSQLKPNGTIAYKIR